MSKQISSTLYVQDQVVPQCRTVLTLDEKIKHFQDVNNNNTVYREKENLNANAAIPLNFDIILDDNYEFQAQDSFATNTQAMDINLDSFMVDEGNVGAVTLTALDDTTNSSDDLPFKLLLASTVNIGRKTLSYGFDAITLRPVFVFQLMQKKLELNSEEFTKFLKSPITRGLHNDFEAEFKRVDNIGTKTVRRVLSDGINYVSLEVKRNGERIFFNRDDIEFMISIGDVIDYDLDAMIKSRSKIKHFALKLREKLDRLQVQTLDKEFSTLTREVFWHDLAYPDSSLFGIDAVKLRLQYVAFYKALTKKKKT